MPSSASSFVVDISKKAAHTPLVLIRHPDRIVISSESRASRKPVLPGRDDPTEPSEAAGKVQ